MSFLKLRRKGQNKEEQEESFATLPENTMGISPAAALKIKQLSKHYLRVAIKGGGCSGLSIHYEFCEQKLSSDLLFTQDEAQIIIDKKSLSILGGATLHFKERLGTGEFILVNNPAAKQCSCGQSFAM